MFQMGTNLFAASKIIAIVEFYGFVGQIGELEDFPLRNYVINSVQVTANFL